MKKKIKLLFILLLLFAILVVCYSRYIEPERLTVKEITVETNMEIETCRIVFFTDTHFGTLYDEKHIERIYPFRFFNVPEIIEVNLIKKE